MRILAVDVGGTHIKVLVTGQAEPRKVDSGPDLTPRSMVDVVRGLTSDWQYDVVSVGYPGPVVHNAPAKEPVNLGPGWVGFDFTAAFGHPTRLINDAAMQALGSYEGGRMLFLGLGTGLGSAMIVDGSVVPMELAHLPYKNKLTYEDYVGLRGLKRLGKKKWRKEVTAVLDQMTAALQPDYIVLGGGNAKLVKDLPPNVRPGANANAFEGGFRLWGSTLWGGSAVAAINGVHAIIFSQDADGVRAFMRDVLGFASVDAGGGWLIFALPPAELGIHPDEGPGHHELYLMCDDLDASMEELKARGAEFPNPVTEAGFGRVASMKIPGGSELALYEPRHPVAIQKDHSA
ncbi:MAG: ROK family protein [Chloroflexi bacterium]|nr:ROK family protein [Chloroflexota bacterium]